MTRKQRDKIRGIMTEKDYKAKVRKVRTRLKRSKIPEVARDTGIPDRWLRYFRDGEILIPKSIGRPRVLILAEYYDV